MARGPSGKLVIEVDPALKRALHARLAAENKTMKEWLIERAKEYLRAQQPLPLGVAYGTTAAPLLKAADSTPSAPYGTRRSS